jgi:hypothetical protein
MTTPFPSRRGPGGGDGGSEESRPEDHALLACPAPPRHQQTQATANKTSHGQVSSHFLPVFQIRNRIRTTQCSSVADPDPDLDPSIIVQKYYSKKNLDSYRYYIVTPFDFLSLKKDVNVP